jgi:D-serine deaminase-like pyridoxal phosphate-dependent protein
MAFQLDAIAEPTLLLDEVKCRKNIRFMADKAKRLGLSLYPHFKTHQSREIGRWVKESGIYGIAVSSTKMAKYFKDIKDITLALPLNIRAMPSLNRLAQQTGLTVLLGQIETAEALVKQVSAPLRVFIEVDAGYQRSGINVQQREEIAAIIALIQQSGFTSFRGFYIHPGNSYGLSSLEDKKAIHEQALAALHQLKASFHTEGLEYRLGDTPNCTLMEDFAEVSSIGPGNYVFYDYMMAYYGNCQMEDIAVCLAASILEVHQDREELIVHGGAVHLSKEYLNDLHGKSFGLVVQLGADAWSRPIEGAYVKKLSQEHGTIHMPKSYFKDFRPGGLLGILPVHSCLTAQCMKGYLSSSGKWIDHVEGN